MTRLVADLPTPTALRLWGAVDALAAQYARAQPGLRIGAARADALADLVGANATISTTIELVTPVQAQAPGSLSAFGPAASTDCLGPATSDPLAPIRTRRLTRPPSRRRAGSSMSAAARSSTTGSCTTTTATCGSCPRTPRSPASARCCRPTSSPCSPTPTPPCAWPAPTPPPAPCAGRTRHLPPRRPHRPRGPLPRRHLPLPRLRDHRPPLPARPRHPPPRRPHPGHQPPKPVRHPPRLQTPRRLARADGPPRCLHLDRTRRTHPHHLAHRPPPYPRAA